MTRSPTSRGERGFAIGFSLLLIRGALLWVVVPVSAVVGLVCWPVLRAKRMSVLQLIGWADLNLVAAIEHSVLRPFVRRPRPWTPLRELPNVEHRVGGVDFA